jgi:hypothetical protein
MPPLAATGAVYYVAVKGEDGNPGSEVLPWGSIGRAATQAQAGDLVVVEPGTYQEAVVLARSGAADAPIVFRGLPGAALVSPDSTQSYSAFDVGTDVSYIILQGFDLGGGFAETVFVRPGAHHIELAGLHIHDNHTGIWISGASDVFVHDAVLERNYRTGLRIFGGARRVHVADSRSEANDDGLGCNGESDGFNADDSTSDISFERVSAVGNSQDGFDVQTPSSSLRQAMAQDNGCSGVKLAAGGFVENSLIEGSRTGMTIAGLPPATTVVQNCTVSQNDLGVRALGPGCSLVMRNSIITGPAKALSYAAGVELIEHHNIFYRPVPSERLIARMDANGETLFSGDDVNDGVWQAASGQGQDTLARDPGFEPGSCEPGADSIAVDSGDQSGSPAVDLVGTVRPVGDGVDRGAFERVTDLPNLRLRRLVLRGRPTGTGIARLDADVSLPAQLQFNPLLDAVSVSIRGSRGEAVHLDLPSRRRTQVARSDGKWVEWSGADTLGHAEHFRLNVSPDRVRVWLSARDAEMWTVDGTQVSVTIELGGLRATAAATPRMVRHTLVVR